MLISPIPENDFTPDWPGKTVTLLEPGHQKGDEAISDLESTSLIIEFLEQPVGDIDMLREAILASAQRHWLDGSEILAVMRGPVPDLESLSLDVEENPQQIRYHSGDSQSYFLFGAEVASHPMFVTFFRNMQSGMSDDHLEASLDVMREHLT